ATRRFRLVLVRITATSRPALYLLNGHTTRTPVSAQGGGNVSTGQEQINHQVCRGPAPSRNGNPARGMWRAAASREAPSSLPPGARAGRPQLLPLKRHLSPR